MSSALPAIDVPPRQSTTDVVIVGSGPTGLMAGALLSRCGINFRILDKTDQQAHESRAFGVQARSLELLLSMGLADEFLNRGWIASGAQMYVDGRQVAELNIDDLGRADTPYSFLLMVPQWDIEAILVDDLRRRGIEVEHRTEVTGFTQHADHVLVTARGPSGEPLEVRAAYVIGADGAHSIVRKTLGLTFAGAPYPQNFLLADCQIDWPLDYHHLKLFFGTRELAIYLPLRGKDYGRIIAVEPSPAPTTGPAVEADKTEPVTLEEVQTIVRAASKLDVTLKNARWLTRYRIHHRGVNKYGQGRAFVAGDAAHIHSPAGGQGMNTGLQDAANLVWKLALVIRGQAPPTLLDTYHAERWPVGQKILNFTDKFFSVVASQTTWIANLRNFLLPVIAGTITKSHRARSKAFHFVSQLGIRYHDNDFLVDEISGDATRAWREGLTPGHRAPNGLFAHNQDIFGLIGGYGFHLLALSQKPLDESEIARLDDHLTQLRASVGLKLQTHAIVQSLIGRDARIHRAESNQAFEMFGLSHTMPEGLFLVRPDGHIAYRSDKLDFSGVRRFITERFNALPTPQNQQAVSP